MIRAGQLRDRITFEERRDQADDGFGNVLTAFEEQFTVWARKQYLRGGENVMASRLEGNQPVVITVRRSSDTLRITTDWRARQGDDVLNIRSVTPAESRDAIDLLCERGVADG